MKRIQLLRAMLTGGTLCASLTGCVTVSNHYPGPVASQSRSAAPVYASASGECQCTVPMNHAPAMSAGYAAPCRCGSLSDASYPGYNGYFQYPVGQNPATNPGPYSQQPSFTERSETGTDSRIRESHVVYVPVTPPIVPQAPTVRTDTDRTRDIVDVLVHAIDALQEAGENDNSSAQGTGGAGNSGTAGTGRTGQTGGDVIGGIALGGRTGTGDPSPGNPTRNPVGNPGGMGGRAGSAGTNSSSMPENPGTLTGPGGRASSSGSSSSGSLPSSANGSQYTGMVSAVDKDVVSPQTLPSSTDSRSGGQKGELTARPVASGAGSVSVTPSNARGGSEERVRKADETTVGRTVPGTQGTASRQSGNTSREAQLGGPVQQQRTSTVPMTSNAPASVATGSPIQEIRGRKEEAKPEKREAVESESSSSTAAQQQTLSSPAVATPPKVAATSAPQAATGASPGTVQALPATVQTVEKAGTGTTVSISPGQLSNPQ